MDKSLCNPRKSVADLDFRSSSRVLLRACSACPILPKDSPIRKIRKMPASPEQLLLQLFVIFVAAANGRDQRRHNCSSTVRHERVIDSYSEDHSGSSGFR